MIPGAANEGCGGMTVGAIQASHYVVGVGLGIHAGRGNTMAVVTSFADKARAGMIDHRWGEADRIMTDTAILVGRYMIKCFGCG